jgi:hypothetical protein
MPPLFPIHAAWDQYQISISGFRDIDPFHFLLSTHKSDSFPLVIPQASRSFSSSFSQRREVPAWIILDDEKWRVIAHRWRLRGLSPLASPLSGGSSEGYTQTSATTIMTVWASSRWESFDFRLHGDPFMTWARNHQKVLSHLRLAV